MADISSNGNSDKKAENGISDKKTFSGKPFHQVDYFVNKDDQHIFCKYWAPEQTPKALILLVHGYAEHCSRYDKLAKMLNELGFYVFANDHVGHGETEGQRCDIKDYNVYLRDLLQHIELMKEKYPGLPLYLFGHSMGGALAILLTHHNQELFKFTVLSSPLITKNVEFQSSVKMFMAKNLSSLLPNLGVAKLDVNAISRDDNQVQKYSNDPLVYHGPVKLRMAWQIYRITEEIERIMPAISYPYLVIHGDADELCDVAGSNNLHDLCKSTDKSIKIYKGCKHELIHEVDDIPDRFLQDIRTCLEEQLSNG